MGTSEFMQQFFQVILDHAKKSGLSVSLLVFYAWYSQTQFTGSCTRYEEKQNKLEDRLESCESTKESLRVELEGLKTRVEVLSIQQSGRRH